MGKYITKNCIKYELRIEQYCRKLELYEQTDYKIGKYGQPYFCFIKKYRITLLLAVRLNEHIHNIDGAINERLDLHIM